MTTIRRVYFYAVAFITLGMFASGGQIMLRLGFDIIKGPALVRIETPGFSSEQLSLGLAMLVIGGILWLLFWRAVKRQVSANPSEVGTAIRKLFLNIILVVTALTGLIMAARLLDWLMAGAPREQFSPEGLATLIVAGAIWYYHWRVSEVEGQPSPAAKTLRRWYVYLLSAWGLVWLSVGPIQLINQAILSLPIFGETIASSGFWSSGVRHSLSWILLGVPIWTFHWFHMARGDYDSTLRQVYLYLLAILGGAIAGLIALTTSLFNVFKFVFGSLSGGASLQFLGWTVPTMLVAAAVWYYHRQAGQEEVAQLHERRLSTRRVYFYLMTVLGLGTLIAGLIIVLGILLDLPINAASHGPVAVSPGWWHQQLSLGLAMLLVASPIWLYYWNAVNQLVAEGGVTERVSRSRRFFLYVLLGAAIITLAADLVNIVFQLLNGLLQGTFEVEILRNSKWSLQTLVVAVPVLWYHWHILREDQRSGAEKLAPRKSVTMLADESAADLLSRLEVKLGSHIRQLRYLGLTPEEIPAMSDEEVDRLISDIQAAPGDRVMLIVTGGKVMVLPYQEK